MFETDVRCENVACNAVVDFVISQSANELNLSPNSSVRKVTTANALGNACDVGSTKKCVTSPPRSIGSRFISIEELRRIGDSIIRFITKESNLDLDEIQSEVCSMKYIGRWQDRVLMPLPQEDYLSLL